ncbi:hypothetical protein BaRGS_00004799, partial [Batillaria attramentaria]
VDKEDLSLHPITPDHLALAVPHPLAPACPARRVALSAQAGVWAREGPPSPLSREMRTGLSGVRRAFLVLEITFAIVTRPGLRRSRKLHLNLEIAVLSIAPLAGARREKMQQAVVASRIEAEHSHVLSPLISDPPPLPPLSSLSTPNSHLHPPTHPRVLCSATVRRSSVPGPGVYTRTAGSPADTMDPRFPVTVVTDSVHELVACWACEG